MHSGNVALSDIITVQPFDDGMRGKIGYLRGVQLPGSSSAASLYTQQGLINPFIPNGNTNIDAFRIIELRWYYQTEFLSSLMEFKIYFRFTQNSPGAPGDPDPRGWQLVKTLSVADALEMAGAMHFDGYGFVHDLGVRANEVSLQNTEYRIVAYHKDGGSSLPATVIVGNLGGN